MTLVEAILKHGTEKVAGEIKVELWRVMKWSDFRYQEGNKDVAAGIREKSKNIMDLVSDPAYLYREREEARKIAEKLNIGRFNQGSGLGPDTFNNPHMGGAFLHSSMSLSLCMLKISLVDVYIVQCHCSVHGTAVAAKFLYYYNILPGITIILYSSKKIIRHRKPH